MLPTSDEIREYRARAESCRRRAEGAADFPQEKATWLQMAGMWDELAQRVDETPAAALAGAVAAPEHESTDAATAEAADASGSEPETPLNEPGQSLPADAEPASEAGDAIVASQPPPNAAPARSRRGVGLVFAGLALVLLVPTLLWSTTGGRGRAVAERPPAPQPAQTRAVTGNAAPIPDAAGPPARVVMAPPVPDPIVIERAPPAALAREAAPGQEALPLREPARAVEVTDATPPRAAPSASQQASSPSAQVEAASVPSPPPTPVQTAGAPIEESSETGSLARSPEPQPVDAGRDTPAAEPRPVEPPRRKVALAAPPRAPAPAAHAARKVAVEPPEPEPEPDPYLGTWWPNACPSGRDRKGAIPMVLDPKRARAGPASCSFTKKTHKGSTWTVAGRCSDGTSSWAATVRLVVDGKRLTWSSERGTQVYRRCG